MVAKRKAKARPNRFRYSKLGGFVIPPKGSKLRLVTIKPKKKK